MSAPVIRPARMRPVELRHAARLINHGPTVLVTTATPDGRRDIMAAAWSMPVEFDPPRIAVVIDKKTLTRELASERGGFGLVVPGAARLDLTHAVGSVSGRDVDKFAAHRLAPVTGPVLGMPLLEDGCAAWLECRLYAEPHTEDAYDTCFAEVVAAAADDRIFRDGRWHYDADNLDLRSIHHLGGGLFGITSAAEQARSG